MNFECNVIWEVELGMGRAGTRASPAQHDLSPAQHDLSPAQHDLSPAQHEPAMSTTRHADTSGGPWATHEQHYKSLAWTRHEHNGTARKLARLFWLKFHNI